jgi:hypothetical protein
VRVEVHYRLRRDGTPQRVALSLSLGG